MSRIGDAVIRCRSFFQEVGEEVAHSEWPKKQELIESTIIVLALLLLLSLFVGVFDKILVEFFKLITR